MIRIYERPAKPKKKPGWKAQEQQHQEWLKKVSSMTLFSTKPAPPRKKVVAPVAKVEPAVERRSSTSFGVATKPVPRPEITYRDNPEMLERELKARERRFNVAPAYHKGNDVFVTEEELAAQLRGNKRRL
jgi:hypothetical protein